MTTINTRLVDALKVADSHAHHWLVESPDLAEYGKPCKAECRDCNAKRTFPKHFESTILPQYRDKATGKGFDADVLDPAWDSVLAAALALDS